jgi:hypothetical protein
MQQRKINPPLQDDFEEEHHDLYGKEGRRKGNMKAVCARSGISPSKFSRRLNDEEPVRDHLYDSVMEVFGAVESGQVNVARGIVGMFNRYAADFGLSDGSPLTTLQDVIQMIQRINLDEIKKLDEDRQLNFLAFLTILQDIVKGFSTALCRERRSESRPSPVG